MSSLPRSSVAAPRGLLAWFEQRLELDRAGATSNLRPMEGLRGLAVFLVFLVHYMSLTKPWWEGRAGLSGLADQVQSMGNVGVDLFFVLSGFLIYGALISKQQSFLPFIARRIRRIYPAFLAVFALYVLLSWLVPSQSKLPAGWSATLIYLLQNLLLLPGIFPIDALIAVAWSLSYEFFYYLCMPVLVAVASLRARSQAQRILFFALLGVAATAAFAVFGGPVRLLMFMAGILLFEARAAELGKSFGSFAGIVCLLLALFVATLPLPGPFLQTLKCLLLGLLFFVLCLASFGHRDSVLARALAWTPLRWLGNMSYSYYLIHGLALKAAVLVLARLLPAPTSDPALWFALLPPLLFAVTLVPSLLLFLWVERPFSLAATAPGAGPVPPSTNPMLPDTAVGMKEHP